MTGWWIGCIFGKSLFGKEKKATSSSAFGSGKNAVPVNGIVLNVAESEGIQYFVRL
jgi:hypothetical protein